MASISFFFDSFFSNTSSLITCSALWHFQHLSVESHIYCQIFSSFNVKIVQHLLLYKRIDIIWYFYTLFFVCNGMSLFILVFGRHSCYFTAGSDFSVTFSVICFTIFFTNNHRMQSPRATQGRDYCVIILA